MDIIQKSFTNYVKILFLVICSIKSLQVITKFDYKYFYSNFLSSKKIAKLKYYVYFVYRIQLHPPSALQSKYWLCDAILNNL